MEEKEVSGPNMPENTPNRRGVLEIFLIFLQYPLYTQHLLETLYYARLPQTETDEPRHRSPC